MVLDERCLKRVEFSVLLYPLDCDYLFSIDTSSGDKAARYSVTVKYNGDAVPSYDFNLRNNPPEVGEGSQEVLKSIGLTKKEIDELDKSGVIALFGERDMIQE